MEARNLLKKHLGYQEVWRGTMMTDEELKNVSKVGLNS
jgi:hypothetical protein